MAHFAELDENNIVLRVIVVRNEDILSPSGEENEQIGIDYCKSLFGADTAWKQTSYNNNFRGKYAGIGYSYSEELDVFLTPQPYPSWSLNKTNKLWEPPLPYPDDKNLYQWDEDIINWVVIEQQSKE